MICTLSPSPSTVARATKRYGSRPGRNVESVLVVVFMRKVSRSAGYNSTASIPHFHSCGIVVTSPDPHPPREVAMATQIEAPPARFERLLTRCDHLFVLWSHTE